MNERFTGRYRFRTEWRGLLILQGEFEAVHSRVAHGIGGPEEERVARTEWRDMRVKDLPWWGDAAMGVVRKEMMK